MVMLHALDEDDGPIPELVDESESEDAGETITGGCSTNRMLLSMHQVTRVSIINRCDSGRHFTAPYYSGLESWMYSRAKMGIPIIQYGAQWSSTPITPMQGLTQ